MRNAAAVEHIPASGRLDADGPQIGCDARDRRPRAAKAVELRVPRISLRPPAQDGLSQERFSPERDQAARVQILRVETPEPHGGSAGRAYSAGRRANTAPSTGWRPSESGTGCRLEYSMQSGPSSRLSSISTVMRRNDPGQRYTSVPSLPFASWPWTTDPHCVCARSRERALSRRPSTVMRDAESRAPAGADAGASWPGGVSARSALV